MFLRWLNTAGHIVSLEDDCPPFMWSGLEKEEERKKHLVSMVGSHRPVSGCPLWSDGDCGLVCLHPVQPLRPFRQHCWLTAFSLCVRMTEGFRSVLYLPALITKWLWTVLCFPTLGVTEKLCVDRCAGIFMMRCIIKTCHPFLPLSSCSFWCFHTYAPSIPSNFNISITNLCAESEEILNFPCIWLMYCAVKTWYG